MTNGDSVNGIISDKKLKVVQENGFIHKLTKKIYSILSHINICYYVKIRIPVLHRHFFRTVTQITEYVKTHCNDINSPLHFACRKWILDIDS